MPLIAALSVSSSVPPGTACSSSDEAIASAIWSNSSQISSPTVEVSTAIAVEVVTASAVEVVTSSAVEVVTASAVEVVCASAGEVASASAVEVGEVVTASPVEVASASAGEVVCASAGDASAVEVAAASAAGLINARRAHRLFACGPLALALASLVSAAQGLFSTGLRALDVGGALP